MRKNILCLGFTVMAMVLIVIYLYPVHLYPDQPGQSKAGITPSIVAAHYAPWYQGNWVWYKGGTAFYTAYTPKLGHYDNRKPSTLSQHIQWAKNYGINTFMIEWCGIANKTYPASYNDTVLTFLANANFKKINFYFVYSIVSALRKNGEKTFDTVDFNDQGNVNKMIADFKYAAQHYFNQSNQLKINGKPVIYIWATGLARGDFAGVLKTLRDTIKKQYSLDMYIIADVVGWNSEPDAAITPLFDAVMPYGMLKVEGQPPANYTLEESIDEIIPQYAHWYFVCRDLGIDFIPGVIPGYNPLGAPWNYNDALELTNPVIARSPGSFKDFVKKAKAYIDPVVKMFYITSWSEWNEGTNIEPSEEFAFDYLEALKHGLAESSPITLPANVITFSFKKVFDPEGPGDDRLLGVCFDSVEFLDAQQQVLQTIDIGGTEARKYMGLGWFANEGPWNTDAENFAWGGMKWQYATLNLNLPPGTVYMRLRTLSVEEQETTISLNSVKKAAITGTPWAWQTHLVLINPANLPAQIQLNRSKLAFGASVTGTVTNSQDFLVSNGGGGILNWTIGKDQAWLTCSPISGTNAGPVSVTANPAGLVPGIYTGNITVSDPNAVNSPQTITITFKVYGVGATAMPFGDFSTPTHGSTVRSSVPFTGWVLDDTGVESVKIYRKSGMNWVYIGDAVFVEGARPDIERSYPGYPMNYRAGWGYMMLTHFLPGGNGVFTIQAVANDMEGHQTTLGTKTITVDNANAVNPFGAIDTPAQGGTVSGKFRNHGWVLTSMPNAIPVNGSTISVYIDGNYLGHPTYNINRTDIASFFPGYANSNGAGAYFDIDTTAYANGIHSIYWIVSDNAGHTEGIGSRFFSIQNTGADGPK